MKVKGRERPAVEIVFPNPWTLKATIGGRSLTARGEAFLPGYGSPDFELYLDTISRWDDGTPIDHTEREEVVRLILDAAKWQGIQIEVV